MKIGANDIAAVKIGSVDVNKVYIGSNLVWQKQAESYLLDLFPNSEGAYSLRQLQSNGGVSYPLVLVRRSSDSAEQSFTETQIIDGTLEAFCGAGNGQVVSWYDQSGNNNHVNQSTASNQPYIVISGNLVTDNGKPTVYFNSLSELVSVNNTNYGTSSRSIFITINLLEAISTKGIISLSNLSTGSGKLWILTPEIATRANTYTWITSTPLPQNNQSLLTNIYASSANLFDGNNMYLDGNVIVRTGGVDGVIDTSIGQMYIGSNGLGASRVIANISEVVNYKSDQSSNRTAIETNINSHYNIYWDGSQSGLLDDYPNASAAYSLRALNSNYLGAAIRVRRSSDSAEQDIKLLYNGELDTEGLLSFVGANDGFVTVWYDQSGDGNDAIQATATKQGKIVDLGNLIINPDNMLPSVEAMGNNKSMIIPASSALNLFAVAKINALVNANYFSFSTSPFSGMYYGGTASGLNGIGLYSLGLTNSLTGEDLNTHLANYYHNGSNYLVSKDSDTNVDLGVFTKANIVQILGRDLNAPTSLNGLMQEMIIYSTGDDSNNESIKSNINSHYNIY